MKKMVSFYPGPSRVYDDVPVWVKQAHAAGILSMNHRSPEFMDVYKKVRRLMLQKLEMPAGYTLLFTGSATECWEIIAQSLVEKSTAHFYNGAFGEKWFQYTKKIRPAARAVPFATDFPDAPLSTEGADVLAVTQNETSNGTQVASSVLSHLRKTYPDVLLAVDATSSMAGIQLPWKKADVWFASVQKCFGLPAGLAVMVCSPAAIARARTLAEAGHYNSLTLMADMAEKDQTSFTPNVLGIYLLMRSLEQSPGIRAIHQQTVERYEQWTDFLQKNPSYQFITGSPALRSHTVLALRTTHAMAGLKQAARKSGLLLGEGYGELKNTSFRIANFPALRDSEIRSLMRFLRNYQEER